MRKELEELASTHLDQFSVWYTLDRPPVGMSPLPSLSVGQQQPCPSPKTGLCLLGLFFFFKKGFGLGFWVHMENARIRGRIWVICL